MTGKKVAFSELSVVQQEHYEVARSFDAAFSSSDFKRVYQEHYPDRNLGSILPSDFSYNNAQKDRDRFPSFLLTLAPSLYRFVGLDHDNFEVREPIGTLSRAAFERTYKKFNRDLDVYNGSKFAGFDEGLVDSWESYKSEVRSVAQERLDAPSWNPEDVGSGRVLAALIEAIEIRINGGIRNNLVAWEARRNQPSQTLLLRHDLGKGSRREAFEKVLFELFQGRIEHELALTRIVELIGRRYSIVAYIFFLIDDTRYMPIATQTFDAAFLQLGIDLRTSGQCSWSNYLAYNEAISWVRDALVNWKQFSGVRLLDAHSWVWMMARLPREIERQRAQGVMKPDDVRKKMVELGWAIVQRVAQANGQKEERVIKNKEIFDFPTTDALYGHLDELWKRQEGLCALTGLPMQLSAGKGAPNLMVVSVDRINSDLQYSPDNLQLTCWFANSWKGTTPNREFLRLLALVREGGLQSASEDLDLEIEEGLSDLV